MHGVWRDVKGGLRALVRAPAFALVTVLTLSLAIGANTAVYSVLDAVLLRPLPYPDAETLVTVDVAEAGEEPGSGVLSRELLAALEAEPSLFAGVGGWRAWAPTFAGPGEAGVVVAAAVTEQMLVEVLGVQPSLGRAFLPDEHEADGTRTVVLSHALWRDRLGSDPSVLGRALVLDEMPYTIVGVMPDGFRFPYEAPAELWTPEVDGDCRPSCGPLHAIARLRPESSLPVSRDRAAVAVRAWAESRADGLREPVVGMSVLRGALLGGFPSALALLTGAVGLVLLLACTNVATLHMVRGAAREREITIRRALGAREGTVVRQLVTESIVLALLGGGLGVGLAIWGTDALVAFAPPMLPGLDLATVNPRVLGVTTAVSIAAGLLFGLTPALRWSTRPLRRHPAARRRGGSGTGRSWITALVIGQVALATSLMVGAGLLLRSLQRLEQVDLGFEPRGVLTTELELPASRLTGSTRRVAAYEALAERLNGTSGVVSLGAITAVPTGAAPREARVRLADAGGAAEPGLRFARVQATTPGYFYTVGQRLADGRAFDDRDGSDARPVAIVNETFARRFLGHPRQRALGRRLALDSDGASGWREVVGVVADARQAGPRAQAEAEVHVPFAQAPGRTLTLVVRVDGDPRAMGAPVRRAVAAADPELIVRSVEPMSDLVARTVRADRFAVRLLGAYAWCVLLVAAVGVYGVVSQGMSRRFHELGVRLALGAGAEQLHGLALRLGVGVAAAGIGLGLLASLGLGGLLEASLYGVSATDPVTLATTGLVLGAASLTACWAPARRAATIDPASVLREE